MSGTERRSGTRWGSRRTDGARAYSGSFENSACTFRLRSFGCAVCIPSSTRSVHGSDIRRTHGCMV